MKANTRPLDILLLGPQWPTRALLRAQILEEGYEVAAADSWPIEGPSAKLLTRARIVIVDLQGLPAPRIVLEELHKRIDPARVLVVTASGTLPNEDVRRLGFHVIPRPASIADIVAAAVARLRNDSQ